MSGLELLVSDNRGVYIPQTFAENFDLSVWKNIDPKDIETLKEGPDAEWYWEAWESVLNSASYVKNGQAWFLYQDGDLWAYNPDLMTDEEYKDFFGEERNS